MTEKKFAKGLILLLILAVFDGISTYVLYSRHQIYELNPIMRWALESKNHPYLFFIIKSGLTFLGAWFFWKNRSTKIAQIALIMALVLYTAIMLLHIHGWYIVCRL